MKPFYVTVIIKAMDFYKTYKVMAQDEWKARTQAMISYDGDNIGGCFVDYVVIEGR